jgi:pre-mRNA-splicing factor ATP-dependent RNA helicase DHX15/PRP43
VTEIHPEWLLELTANFYDLATFPDGETKQALQRVLKKQLKKQIGRNAKVAGSKPPKKILEMKKIKAS